MKKIESTLDGLYGPKIVDVSAAYGNFVTFTANNAYPIHRWFRFKEGFSRDLVHLLIGGCSFRPQRVLDPFGGVGTTALACQEIGIVCDSIEVNPFLFDVAATKLQGFEPNRVKREMKTLSGYFDQHHKERYRTPLMKTFTRRPGLKKWLFHPPVAQGMQCVLHGIEELDLSCASLFKLGLAVASSRLGNTHKDGKCVRYNDKWEHRSTRRKDVWREFEASVRQFLRDIVDFPGGFEGGNGKNLLAGSALDILPMLNHEYDLVVTSPPYPNSFDYTDVYMPELWALGYVRSYEDVAELRKMTIRSHVQVRWEDAETEDPVLSEFIDSISKGELWNGGILIMLRRYFQDMWNLLEELDRLVARGGRVCIVVGNCSYNGVVIPVDFLVAWIGERYGFRCFEIRVARNLRRSTQQSGRFRSSEKLRESIVILDKN